MKTTEPRLTKEKTYLIVKYGMHTIGSQEPYFSITADEYRSSRPSERGWLSGGQQHELVRKVFPELAHLTRWHLCFEKSGPMHYLANGLFWWDAFHGMTAHSQPEDRERAPGALAHTVVLGALEDDVMVEALLDLRREQLESYLKSRLSRLMEAFRADMKGME